MTPVVKFRSHVILTKLQSDNFRIPKIGQKSIKSLKIAGISEEIFIFHKNSYSDSVNFVLVRSSSFPFESVRFRWRIQALLHHFIIGIIFNQIFNF